MDKQKKIFIIGGLIEGAILIFDLIVSILVWTTIVPAEQVIGDYQKACIDKNGPFIGFLQANPMVFFCVFCIPLFIIIAVDFIYFAVLASKKESKLTDEQIESIRAKAKKLADEEIMRELEEEEANPKSN